MNSISYYKELFENAHEPILLIDGHHFVDANQAALNILKISSKSELSVVHPAQISPKYQPDGELSKTKVDRFIKDCYIQGSNKFEWLYKRLNGKRFTVEVTLKTIQVDNKELLHVSWKDMQERKKYKKKLKKQNNLLAQKNDYIDEVHSMLQSNNSNENLVQSLSLLNEYKRALDESAIVSKTDLDGNITYVNDKFCKISGYTREELVGQNHNIVRHPHTEDEVFEELWETIKNKKIFKAMIKNKSKKGKSYCVDSTIIPILDKENNIVEYIGIRHDLTKILEKEKVIREQYTDELSGLKNRQKLLVDIKKKILPKLAILNIDRFKNINEYYGFETGDEILKQVASLLLSLEEINLRVYRIAGDVFAILAMGNYSLEDFYILCENFKNSIDNEAFKVEDNIFDISLSIGIALNGKKLLAHAEIALHHAKQTNQAISVFDSKMPSYKMLQDNIELTKDIKYAIKNDDILIYGQKIINNKTGVEKYEVLMRMRKKNGKIISPFFFIEHSKKAKLYSALTKIIIQKSCSYFEDKNINFAINLDIQDITNEDITNYLFEELSRTKTASKATLEIVESEGIAEFAEVREFIKRFKKLGCKIAIDDFGTGYSNFEYIVKLDIDILKIDGSLIDNIDKDKNMRLTVSAIVNFAKALGIKVVAEFVHSKEILEVVKSLDIDFSQGYLLHEPEHLKI